MENNDIRDVDNIQIHEDDNKRQEYINICLSIIDRLNNGVSLSELKHEVISTGFPSACVDGVISLEHYIMYYKSNNPTNLDNESIILNLTSKGWPKEITLELLKTIEKRIKK